VVDKDNTTLIGGKGKQADIQGRIGQIRAAIEKSTSDYDKEKLQERLAKLAGGVAVINVGAATETEMKEKKSRWKTRCTPPAPRSRRASCRAAVSRFCGAGSPSRRSGATMTMRRPASRSSARARGTDPDHRPERRSGSVHRVGKVKESDKLNYGYNAQTDEYEDLVAAGVIDPTKVTRTALQNAASIADCFSPPSAWWRRRRRRRRCPDARRRWHGRDVLID